MSVSNVDDWRYDICRHMEFTSCLFPADPNLAILHLQVCTLHRIFWLILVWYYGREFQSVNSELLVSWIGWVTCFKGCFCTILDSSKKWSFKFYCSTFNRGNLRHCPSPGGGFSFPIFYVLQIWRDDDYQKLQDALGYVYPFSNYFHWYWLFCVVWKFS